MAVYDLTHTAVQIDNAAEISISDGIFIMYHRRSDNYSVMAKTKTWAGLQASGEIADGVAVVQGGKVLVVAPTESAGTLYWGSANIAGGGFTTDNYRTAYEDWAGETSTTAQITHSELSGTSYAPGFCANYSRTNANGKGLTAGKWWLPSLGELMCIFANKEKINQALSLITGASQLTESVYWSSTEFSATYAWHLYMDCGRIYYYVRKNVGLYNVRPVSAFIP